MKKSTFLLIGLVVNTILFSQNFSISAKSGDTELDATLNDINIKAKTDIKIFKNDMSVEFGVSGGKIDKLLIEKNMSPADVYMTYEIGRMTGKKDDDVLKVYDKSSSKGWGAMAKELGIKPGSPEFHALKGKAKKSKDKGNKAKKGGDGSGNGNGNGKGKGKGKK